MFRKYTLDNKVFTNCSYTTLHNGVFIKCGDGVFYRKENQMNMAKSNELRFYNLEEYRLFQYLMYIEADMFYEWVRDFMIDPHVEFTAHDMAKDHQAHLEDMFSDNDVLKIGLIKYAFGNCDVGAMHDWMIHEIASNYKGRERDVAEIFSEPNKNLIKVQNDDPYEKQFKEIRAEAEAEALANRTENS